MKYVLITWASSGIGREFAIQLASQGYHCILHGRDSVRLNQVRDQIIALGSDADIITADLSNLTQVDEFAHLIITKYPQISYVINNAGYGLYGSCLEVSLEDQINMINLNCSAMLIITHYIATHRVHNHIQGKILNVASTAAFQPWPGMATYFATKSRVYSWSQALRYELRPHDIQVSILCPGATETNFFEHSGNPTTSPMLSRMMSAHEVVHIALKWMDTNQDLIIPWWTNKILYLLTTITPRWLLLKILDMIIQKK